MEFQSHVIHKQENNETSKLACKEELIIINNHTLEVINHLPYQPFILLITTNTIIFNLNLKLKSTCYH